MTSAAYRLMTRRDEHQIALRYLSGEQGRMQEEMDAVDWFTRFKLARTYVNYNVFLETAYLVDSIDLSAELWSNPSFTQIETNQKWVARSLKTARSFKLEYKGPLPEWVITILTGLLHGHYPNIEDVYVSLTDRWVPEAQGGPPGTAQLPYLQRLRLTQLKSPTPFTLTAPKLAWFHYDECSFASVTLDPLPELMFCPRTIGSRAGRLPENYNSLDVYTDNSLKFRFMLGKRVIADPNQAAEALKLFGRLIREPGKKRSPAAVYSFLAPGKYEEIGAIFKALDWLMLPALQRHVKGQLEKLEKEWNSEWWTTAMFEAFHHLLGKIWYLYSQIVPLEVTEQAPFISTKGIRLDYLFEEGPLRFVPLIRPACFEGVDISTVESTALYHALCGVCKRSLPAALNYEVAILSDRSTDEE